MEELNNVLHQGIENLMILKERKRELNFVLKQMKREEELHKKQLEDYKIYANDLELMRLNNNVDVLELRKEMLVAKINIDSILFSIETNEEQMKQYEEEIKKIEEELLK